MNHIVNCPRNSRLHQNLVSHSDSLVIDPNKILTVLIHILKMAWPTKISMPFLGSLNNLLNDAYIKFNKDLIIVR